ncbi:universal stress protein [Alphaproteobacteria bacterium]|nr:universal stress protein [Alphaproteobacteria bacterium]
MRKKDITGFGDENLLICVDESNEFSAAMSYACKHAQKNKSGLILLYVIEEENFRHWKGVENIMREEQKDQAKEILNKYLTDIKKSYSFDVKTLVKRGEKLEIILKVLNNKRLKIRNLILGLAIDKPENNKIISSLTGNLRKQLSLPITIVPGII